MQERKSIRTLKSMENGRQFQTFQTFPRPTEANKLTLEKEIWLIYLCLTWSLLLIPKYRPEIKISQLFIEDFSCQLTSSTHFHSSQVTQAQDDKFSVRTHQLTSKEYENTIMLTINHYTGNMFNNYTDFRRNTL